MSSASAKPGARRVEDLAGQVFLVGERDRVDEHVELAEVVGEPSRRLPATRRLETSHSTNIESLPFLEAIRQFPVDVGRRRCMFIHLTLVPYIGHAGELKTKPTQHSVNELRRIGIAPDMLMCRSEGPLSGGIRKKIALFASRPADAIVSARDVDNIYKVPLVFRYQGVDDFILEHFALEAPAPDLSKWQEPIERVEKAPRTVRIAL